MALQSRMDLTKVLTFTYYIASYHNFDSPSYTYILHSRPNKTVKYSNRVIYVALITFNEECCM